MNVSHNFYQCALGIIALIGDVVVVRMSKACAGWEEGLPLMAF